MAEVVLFHITEEIINKLGSLSAQEVALWWGLKDQLWKLSDTVTRIKAVIQDAEVKAQNKKQNHQIEDWLKKLRVAVYDAEDLLEDFSTQVLRKQLMSGNRVSREVRVFFSRSNQFVYGLRMGHRVEALRERLNDIEADSKRFNFEVHESERDSLTTVREQTTSSEPEVIVGREDDDQLESLKNELEKKFEKKKYLLVLDDVWDGEDGSDGEKWDSLKELFPRDAVGSKLVVTTRSHVIAKFTSTVAPHVLEGLSIDKSWELFRRKAFPQGQDSDHVDEKIRKEIVERCCGVPLVIKAIASTKVELRGITISDLTRHISFDMELDLSQQIPIPLPCAERLRTLVLLLGGEWDGRAWESICRDFGRLRVLLLSDWGIEEVPPLIEKLKHMKYLDLSNNKIETLPNSVTNLVNLQVLKLNGCRYLKRLPRGINKLINLRHLDNDLCESLEYMPRGIGKLTSLQTLSCFVVAKNRSPKSKMVGGLDELSRLNELRGSLEIRVEGYERESCISEFEGAKLEDKQYLQSLTINWENIDFDIDLDSDIDIDTDMDSDIDLYDKMLQCLQPNSSLQELEVEGYGGMRFPSWLSNLSNLVRICVNVCTRLEHIPPLDGIPSLEELWIMYMYNLEYIDSEGVGGKEVSKFFPSLKKLVIRKCPRLKGWWKESRGEMKDDSDESTVEEELIMLSFPRLSSLGISKCPNLTSMPLFPTLDEGLWLRRSSSMPLQQTMKMKPPVSSSSSSSFIRPLSNLKRLYISSSDDMESLPEVGLQNLSSLQELDIAYCPRLKSLPLHGQGVPSLQKLVINRCPILKSLSESKSQEMIPYLPSLQELRIKDRSEELSRGWGKEIEKVLPNIKHIPNIVIDDYYIQKEGRYVEGEGLRRESARSLEEEGLRYSTVLMNFSTTKLDLDVHGLKECLQGFNWTASSEVLFNVLVAVCVWRNILASYSSVAKQFTVELNISTDWYFTVWNSHQASELYI
ncbi:hypothetical protein DKX38_010784 [Salix brachista]|uniref:Rx N-terminal domain-containing protein n=1 Tax=Salix brachista TaxID=2182728 RepID=A0A5N5MGQ2_9ROSI|nr:hypothetical protein DKX38_010784 [Salix brachista]